MYSEQSAAEQQRRNTVRQCNSVKGAIKLNSGRNKDERTEGGVPSVAWATIDHVLLYPHHGLAAHFHLFIASSIRSTTNGTSGEQSVSMSARQARPVDGYDHNVRVRRWSRSDVVRMCHVELANITSNSFTTHFITHLS